MLWRWWRISFSGFHSDGFPHSMSVTLRLITRRMFIWVWLPMYILSSSNALHCESSPIITSPGTNFVFYRGGLTGTRTVDRPYQPRWLHLHCHRDWHQLTVDFGRLLAPLEDWSIRASTPWPQVTLTPKQHYQATYLMHLSDLVSDADVGTDPLREEGEGKSTEHVGSGVIKAILLAVWSPRKNAYRAF